jgi:hypothetical protein
MTSATEIEMAAIRPAIEPVPEILLAGEIFAV